MSDIHKNRIRTAAVYAKLFMEAAEMEINTGETKQRQDCAVQLEAALNALDEE